VDWVEVAAQNPEMITIRDISVPYAVFANHDDVTTALGPIFEQRMETTLQILWQRWTHLHHQEHV
jgi:hypothetical protein